MNNFKGVSATTKVLTMVLAMSRQEIVSALLDILEIPVKKEKSRKVNLNAIINLKTMTIIFLFYQNCWCYLIIGRLDANCKL